jgi:hypothetical protein
MTTPLVMDALETAIFSRRRQLVAGVIATALTTPPARRLPPRPEPSDDRSGYADPITPTVDRHPDVHGGIKAKRSPL